MELDEEHKRIKSVVCSVDIIGLNENRGRSIIGNNKGITLVFGGLGMNFVESSDKNMPTIENGQKDIFLTYDKFNLLMNNFNVDFCNGISRRLKYAMSENGSFKSTNMSWFLECGIHQNIKNGEKHTCVLLQPNLHSECSYGNEALQDQWSSPYLHYGTH